MAHLEIMMKKKDEEKDNQFRFIFKLQMIKCRALGSVLGKSVEVVKFVLARCVWAGIMGQLQMAVSKWQWKAR